MITDAVEFRKELEKINEWWITNRVREVEKYPYQRRIFAEIIKELESRRITILLGPRRTGKSVLLKQLISFLIKTGIDPSSA